MLEDPEETVHMVGRVRLAGFWSSCAMKNDPVFSSLPGAASSKSRARQLSTVPAHHAIGITAVSEALTMR
jgi:hypothetical protein